MFSVTVHETAHWSHATNSSASFTYAGNFIRESWAVGVEWFITQMEYKERGISNYADWDYFSYSPELPFPMFESYQYWVKGIHNADRSPLFIDLYDSFNQLNQTFHYSSNIPNIDDNVTGYTFQELESVVFSVRSSVLEGLRSLLEANKPLGVSDVDLYRLMFNF